MRNAYVGIDLGTSGCRCAAIDEAGKLLALSRRPLPESCRPQPGYSEQQPEDWWQAVCAALGELARSLADHRLLAIAVDGTSGTLLACDDAGRPLSAALMYDDRRAADRLPRIASHAPPDNPANSASSTLCRALYLLDQQPHCSHLLHQADWIAGRLLGRFGDSDPHNALKLGYDPLAGCWPDWLGAFAGLDACLPRVHPVARRIGTIDPQLAAALGLERSTIIVSGTTDSTASSLASGVAEPGDAVTTLGSTLVMKLVSQRPVFDQRYGIYSHQLDRDRWLVGGASNSGGAVLLRHFSIERIEQLSAVIDPTRPSGLDYYPLNGPGERFPINDPQLMPRLTPRATDEARFLQGMLEGMARIEARAYGLLAERSGTPLRRLRSVGGGAGNTAWQSIREREIGCSMVDASCEEAAYGSALLARRAAADS